MVFLRHSMNGDVTVNDKGEGKVDDDDADNILFRNERNKMTRVQLRSLPNTLCSSHILEDGSWGFL